MQDVANSPGPEISMIDLVSHDGDQSLTAMLEEVIDDHTMTPAADITGHIIDDELGELSVKPAVFSTLPADPVRTFQPAVCSTFSADPVRTLQPAVCSTFPAAPVRIQQAVVQPEPSIRANSIASTYGQASTDE